ncbi:unnamed protein product [Cunninghamella echinulata]
MKISSYLQFYVISVIVYHQVESLPTSIPKDVIDHEIRTLYQQTNQFETTHFMQPKEAFEKRDHHQPSSMFMNDDVQNKLDKLDNNKLILNEQGKNILTDIVGEVGKVVSDLLGSLGLGSSKQPPAGSKKTPPKQDKKPPATPADPPATPAEPPATPADPPATPAEPPATPADPPATPADPPATPADPPATPADPPATPADPPATPADPPATPADPPATPADPPATPADPPATPADPPATPADPPATPADPPATPADPPATPADPPATPADPPATPADPAQPPTAPADPAQPPATPADPPATPADPPATPAEPPATGNGQAPGSESNTQAPVNGTAPINGRYVSRMKNLHQQLKKGNTSGSHRLQQLSKELNQLNTLATDSDPNTKVLLLSLRMMLSSLQTMHESSSPQKQKEQPILVQSTSTNAHHHDSTNSNDMTAGTDNAVSTSHGEDHQDMKNKKDEVDLKEFQTKENGGIQPKDIEEYIQQVKPIIEELKKADIDKSNALFKDLVKMMEQLSTKHLPTIQQQEQAQQKDDGKEKLNELADNVVKVLMALDHVSKAIKDVKKQDGMEAATPYLDMIEKANEEFLKKLKQ